MASIQRAGFSDAHNQNSQVFKALAHPARLAIIEQLVQNERIICKEIELEIPLSQSSVSGHLKILLESGILGYEKIDNVTYYVINPLMLEGASKIIQSTINETNRQDHDYQRTFFKVLPNEEFSVD